MTFVLPKHPRGRVNRAGDVLAGRTPWELESHVDAVMVLANWRASHAYPINTFQALLRQELQGTQAGEREVKKALRKALFRYSLHADENLFEKAYCYIKQYD